MKLYICLTTYHILAACTMAIKDKNDKAELLVESVTDEETELIKSIRKAGIFYKIYYVNQTGAWGEINKLDYNSKIDEIEKAAEAVVGFWKKHFIYFEGITKRYSEINIWDDHFTLGVALAYLKIPYNYFEESPGCNYRREIFIKLSADGITNKAFAPIAMCFGLRGKYPYAVSYNYDFSLNPMEREDKDRDFSLIKELQKMKENNLEGFQKIKQIFAPEGYIYNYCQKKYDEKKKNFLLIGQHYSVSTYKNTNMIRYVLSLLTDYFGENMNIWIKNHPSNYFNPIQFWFQKANYIVSQVPMELMVADGELHFDRVASISSSAPLVMQNMDTDVILFQNSSDSDSFESKKRFLDIHRYFVALKLIEKINKEYNLDFLYTYGAEKLSFEYLIKYQISGALRVNHINDIDELMVETQENEKNRCFFIDCVEAVSEEKQKLKDKISEWLHSCKEKDVIFFINSDRKNIFFNIHSPENMEYVFPLPFELIDSNGDSGLFGYGEPEYPLKDAIGKLHQETYNRQDKGERQIIYMYTKNTNICKKILSDTIQKNLEHCGMKLVYNPTALNYRELVFESMLEQLESQYIELQEKNAQLKEKLDRIQNNESYLEKREETLQVKNPESKEIQVLIDTVNANSTMLMNRMTDIDTHLIKFLTWYGLKNRIKEKLKIIFGRQKKEDK